MDSLSQSAHSYAKTRQKWIFAILAVPLVAWGMARVGTVVSLRLLQPPMVYSAPKPNRPIFSVHKIHWSITLLHSDGHHPVTGAMVTLWSGPPARHTRTVMCGTISRPFAAGVTNRAGQIECDWEMTLFSESNDHGRAYLETRELYAEIQIPGHDPQVKPLREIFGNRAMVQSGNMVLILQLVPSPLTTIPSLFLREHRP
jgi:hypothetical protein